MSKIQIYTDGGARGNPGPAGIGIIIKGIGEKAIEISESIGETTNNQAEYKAIIRALEEIRQLAEKYAIIDKEINCFLDSQLIVEQVNGNYKIKNEGLKPLYSRTRELVIELGGRVSFQYIPRTENTRADYLVNHALDKTP